MKASVIVVLMISGLLHCGSKPPTAEIKTKHMSALPSLTYLALGDSYTIGEFVPLAQSFPYQLTAMLNAAGYNTANPQIIATTGWTTDELISAISNRDNHAKKYDIVTLLIGVNNQYRGYPQNTYRTEFTQLLKTAIKYAGDNARHVFVLSVPNYGVTPYAAGSNRNQIRTGIAQFNAINKQETEKTGAAYIDITPASEKAADDPSLIATDGLHPSAKMYTLWVQELAPVVTQRLK